MRRIILILTLFISIYSFGQVPTGYQKRIVNERIQGSFMVDSVFNIPRYYDTTAANLHIRSDSCGAMFFSYAKDSIYIRLCNPKKWITLGSGGGTSGLDAVLAVNSHSPTITQDVQIDMSNKLFSISNAIEYSALLNTNDWRIGKVNGVMIEGFDASNSMDLTGGFSSTRNSKITLSPDSMSFFPPFGKINIDSLRTGTSDDEILTWNAGMLRKISGSALTGNWSTSGNTGTTGSNFIGTTDNRSLRFRTNNTEKMVIDSSGIVGINTTTPSTVWAGNKGLVVSGGGGDNIGVAFAQGSNAHAIYTSSGTNLNFFSRQLVTNYLIASDATQDITTNWKLKTVGGLRLSSNIADPSGSAGELHYETTLQKFRGYENGAWRSFVTTLDTIVADQQRGTPIGTLFTQTGFAGTTGFTVVGTTPTISNGMLLYVGGGSPSGQHTKLDYYTNLQTWTIKIGFKVGVKNSTSYGIQIGLISANDTYQQDIMARFEHTNVAGSDGYVEIFGSTAHNVSLAKSTTNVSFSAGDSIVMEFTRVKDVLYATARNVTTNSVSASTSYKYLPLDLYVPNTGTPSISMYGGTDSVYHFSYSSQQPIGVDILTIGDSKMGWYSNAYSESIPALLYQYYGNTADHSGGGDKVDEVILGLPETIALKPKVALVTIGSNNIRNGYSEAYIEQFIDTIYNRLTREGIEVKFALMYEPGINQATFAAYLNSTYPNSYIDEGYESTQECASCLHSDNIHLTEIGNSMWVKAVMPSIKFNRYETFYDVGSIIPDTPASTYGRLYNRADSLRFKNDAGTEFTLGTANINMPDLNKGVFLQLPTSADTIDAWQTPVAITITSLKAILRGTSPSVTYNIGFGTNIQSPTAVFTSDITCTSITTGCSNSSGFNDATIPAGSFIWIYTTAASGTIRSISFTINYTED